MPMAAADAQPAPPSPEGSPPPPPPAALRPENRASAFEEIHERADTVWIHADGNGARPAGRGGNGGSAFREPVTVARREDLKGKHGRIAIVDGCRTPFAKAGTVFRDMDVVDLAGAA